MPVRIEKLDSVRELLR